MSNRIAKELEAIASTLEGKTASNLEDVEALLGKTMVKRLSDRVGFASGLRDTWWSVDSKLGDQLTRKLGIGSSGNVYRVGHKFNLSYNQRAGVWVISV